MALGECVLPHLLQFLWVYAVSSYYIHSLYLTLKLPILHCLPNSRETLWSQQHNHEEYLEKEADSEQKLGKVYITNVFSLTKQCGVHIA